MIKCRRYGRKHDGFTLLETLLAFFIISLSVVLLSGVSKLLVTSMKDNRYSDDMIAIHQLRLLLIQADTIQLDQNQLLVKQGEINYTISYHQQRLVKQDGYEIFLEFIDRANFIKEEGCYHVSWQRKKQTTKAILVCE